MALDGFRCAVALANVAGETARVADFILEIDIDAEVQQTAEIVPVKREEAFDDDRRARLYGARAAEAGSSKLAFARSSRGTWLRSR